MYNYEKAMFQSAANYEEFATYGIEQDILNNATLHNIFAATEQYLTSAIENIYEMSIAKLTYLYEVNVKGKEPANVEKAITHDLFALYSRYIYPLREDEKDFQRTFGNLNKINNLPKFDANYREQLKKVKLDADATRYAYDKMVTAKACREVTSNDILQDYAIMQDTKQFAKNIIEKQFMR